MFGLKAVLFDLGDTLIRTAPVALIFDRIVGARGVSRPLREIHAAFNKVEGELRPEDYVLRGREFWKVYNMKILRFVGIQEDLERLSDIITDEWWDNADLELCPNVKETLRKLKERGLKIGLVTNGFRIDIEDILKRTSLTGQFDVTVGADDVGKPKPNPEMFLYALEKLGIQPAEALFVGDNPETDYKGAENAGLKALLVDRENKVRGEFKKIADLREATDYV